MVAIVTKNDRMVRLQLGKYQQQHKMPSRSNTEKPFRPIIKWSLFRGFDSCIRRMHVYYVFVEWNWRIVPRVEGTVSNHVPWPPFSGSRHSTAQWIHFFLTDNSGGMSFFPPLFPRFKCDAFHFSHFYCCCILLSLFFSFRKNRKKTTATKTLFRNHLWMHT